MAACPKCNSELPEGLGLRFCTQCGASLTIAEPAPRKAIDGPSDPGQPTEKPASIRPALEPPRSEEHTSELQSHLNLVCRLLLAKKNHDLGLPIPALATCAEPPTFFAMVTKEMLKR